MKRAPELSSVVWPGPYSVGRGKNAVRMPWEAAWARS